MLEKNSPPGGYSGRLPTSGQCPIFRQFTTTFRPKMLVTNLDRVYKLPIILGGNQSCSVLLKNHLHVNVFLEFHKIARVTREN